MTDLDFLIDMCQCCFKPHLVWWRCLPSQGRIFCTFIVPQHPFRLILFFVVSPSVWSLPPLQSADPYVISKIPIKSFLILIASWDQSQKPSERETHAKLALECSIKGWKKTAPLNKCSREKTVLPIIIHSIGGNILDLKTGGTEKLRSHLEGFKVMMIRHASHPMPPRGHMWEIRVVQRSSLHATATVARYLGFDKSLFIFRLVILIVLEI